MPSDQLLSKSETSARPRTPRLGEELPIFCERCGYSLFGLPQVKCQACHLLHFACPECNHHQPINTLRPAAQRIIGRVRAVVLAFIVLFKLALFGVGLLCWFAMGTEWGYRYVYHPLGLASTLSPAPVSQEMIWAFALLGVATGLICRMFLLRWPSGTRVGLVLGVFVIIATLLGLLARRYDVRPAAVGPTIGVYCMAFLGASFTVAGSIIAWPIWAGMVGLLLPRETAASLLAWQKSQSIRVADLAR